MNRDNTKKYLLHYRQDFALPFIDFLYQYTMYGKIDYICLYNQRQRSFSAYLSQRGLEQASFLGKKKILDNALWKDMFITNEKYFSIVDELKDKPIPEFGTREFTSWWGKILKLTKIISDVYFYCDEPILAELEKREDDPLIEPILYYIGKFKLRAHARLSILDVKFNDLLRKINKEYFIPLESIRVWTFGELIEYIKSNFDENFIPNVQKRKRGYVYLKTWTAFDGVIFKKWQIKLQPTINKQQAEGMVAYKAKEKIRGKVKIHFAFSVADELPKDCVLVTGMTNPQLVPYLKNVRAIITDEGGLMCHAAIISRELKIPCIVGTRDATQIFRDGDLVELDTEKGTITKIE